jgi:hypothetical protein
MPPGDGRADVEINPFEEGLFGEGRLSDTSVDISSKAVDNREPLVGGVGSLLIGLGDEAECWGFVLIDPERGRGRDLASSTRCRALNSS